ncbi:UNKNOWN [Stylonychia lemnae]|uniref:Uncharacterized protein n=1 Tax=Stylonychia lemnae TaxID=5949 RepID=A0A078ARM0_STYLE|nr:UNKNOWN [Stylonychia lemnae]|eukprot:CDW84626.1 UNKNOWN [Stylonychia lemnae]
MSKNIQEPLLSDSGLQLYQSFKSQEEKPEQLINLKSFATLLNGIEDLGSEIPLEGSEFQKKKNEIANTKKIEKLYNLPDGIFSFYCPSKRFAYVIVNSKEMYRINISDSTTKRLKDPKVNQTIDAATATNDSLYIGDDNGQIFKLKDGDDFWTKFQKETDATTKYLAVTPDNKYIIGIFWDHTLLQYDRDDILLKKICLFMIGSCLNFSSDSKLLIITSNYNSYITLMDVETLEELHTIHLPDGKMVLSVFITEDNSAIQYQYLREKELYEYKIKPKPLIKILTERKRCGYMIKFSRDFKYLLYAFWDGTVNVIDFQTNKEVLTLDKGGCPNVDMTKNNQYLISTSSTSNVLIVHSIDIKTFKITLKYSWQYKNGLKAPSRFWLLEQNEKLVVFYDIYRNYLAFLNWETGEQESYDQGSPVKWVHQNKLGTFLFLYLQNRKVVKFDPISRQAVKSIQTIIQWPNSLVSFDNDSKIVIAGCGLQVWDFENEKLIKALDESTTRHVSITLSQSENELYSGGIDKQVKIWDLKNKLLLQAIPMSSGRFTVELSKNEEYIITTGWENFMWSIKNPLYYPIIEIQNSDNKVQNSQVQAIVSQNFKIVDLQQSILSHLEVALFQSLKLKEANIDVALKWLSYQNQTIYPFKFTALHILVANGNYDCIQKALQLGFPYMADDKGKTPLTYAFEQMNLKCVDEIAKYYNESTQDFLITKIDFEQMLQCNLPSVKALFDKIFTPITRTIEGILPEFGTFSENIYIFQDSKDIDLKKISECAGDVDGDSVEPVQYLISQFPINFTPGSQESINILKKLVEADPEIFRTSIQMFIDYKWDQFTTSLKIQAFIYYLYLFIIWINVIYSRNLPIIIVVQISTFLMIMMEGFQFYASKSYYVQDFWNFFDLSGFLIIFSLTFLQEFEYTFEYFQQLQALGISIIFLRGISYLRAFDSTRYLVGMVIEIIKGMKSFFILLIYSMLALALIQITLSHEESQSASDYLDNIILYYRLSMGEWEFDSFSEAWILIVFIFSTLLFPLILMNLLIALMGDTYSRVQDGIIPYDYALKAQLLWELESLMLWKRNQGSSKYMIVYRKKDIEDNASNIQEGQLRQIKSLCLHIAAKVHKQGTKQ